MHWDIIDTGVEVAERIMQRDAEMLEMLSAQNHPILHFYEWKNDSATYGYFVKPEQYLNLDSARRRGLELARRPTGGGIVFHVWDLAFSVLVPSSCPQFSMNILDNYAFVNNTVLKAVKSFLDQKVELELTPVDSPEFDSGCGRFCMAKPTKYDVMLDGRKIAGAAQRKQKSGFLHQGTIALAMPCEEYIGEVLLPGTRVWEAMQAHTFPLLGKKVSPSDLTDARQLLRQKLTDCFTEN
jgi:lipoate-protein ligase A